MSLSQATTLPLFEGHGTGMVKAFYRHSKQPLSLFLNQTFSLWIPAGCTNGSILIWDFDTRGVAKELRPEGEGFWISSVGWSKDGRRLVSATLKNNLISLWDVAAGARISSYKCEYPILRVSLHPKDSTLCLVCPQQGPPLLLEKFGVQGEEAWCAPLLSVDEITAGGAGKGKGGEGVSVSFGAAAFNKRGDLVFVGTARGEVLVVETAAKQVLGRMQIQGGLSLLSVAELQESSPFDSKSRFVSKSKLVACLPSIGARLGEIFTTGALAKAFAVVGSSLIDYIRSLELKRGLLAQQKRFPKRRKRSYPGQSGWTQ